MSSSADSVTANPPAPAARLQSLDAYRGIVMFVLMSGGFGIASANRQMGPDAPAWLQTLSFHVTHPEWLSHFSLLGFSLWDLIQPSFMFIVGVSMPWSYGKRAELGHSFARRAAHAWKRALLLVALGVFLQSLNQSETNWTFVNVLSQIGLGYGFLFFLVGKSFRVQALVAVLVLLASGLSFVLYPAPEGSVGWAAHFEKGSNVSEAFDRWFLNLFPRSEPFVANSGGYSTLNFVPAFVTMLLGLMCGQWLRQEGPAPSVKCRRLWVAGALCLVLGLIAGTTICPIIKRIWTPSWTLFSGAWCIWLLAFLYGLVDLAGWRRWTYPFLVVGLNPITAYFLSIANAAWMRKQWQTHLPDGWFAGPAGPVLLSLLVTLSFWLILWWMHRNRVYLRI